MESHRPVVVLATNVLMQSDTFCSHEKFFNALTEPHVILQEFCRTSLCGYVLNREPHGFYYVSQKRLRPQRLMESTTKPPPPMDPPTDARSSESHMEEAVLESEVDILADSEVQYCHD